MAFLLGVLASFFFSVTFVLNQSMASSGGDWLWTASLRFLFMMPFFFIIVILKRNSQLTLVFRTIKGNWKSWFLWSQVAFGLFYIPLCFASSLAPGWLIASTWQITIIAGSVLAPFLEPNLSKRKQSRISRQDGLIFGVILLGIVIIELQHMALANVTPLLVAFIAVLIAAVAYPLGNRKIMIVNHHTANLNTDERILAMLVCSLPTWLVCSIIGFVRSGVPETAQVASSFLVALFSGVIATYLFFLSTQMVHTNIRKLATIEALQSLEVVFSVVLGMIVLQDTFPKLLTMVGLGLVVLGVCLKVMRS